ncbi:hypothetical protein GIB67_003527, partial [Kingdonia uniflora]
MKCVVLLGFDGERGCTFWLLRREIKVERRLKGFKKKVYNIIFVKVIFDVLDGSVMLLLSFVNLCDD